MDETALYAMLGKKQAQLEAQDAAYGSLLQLMASVVSGAVDPARLLINMTERSWMMAPPGQVPPMPATINGLPLCVTAPKLGPRRPNGEVVTRFPGETPGQD